MGLRGPKSKLCTPAKCAEILGYLSDGSAPFIAIAAERAGINRSTAKTWITTAEQGLTTDPIMHQFAIDVRRVRAEWIARMSLLIQEDEDRNHAAVNRQRAWLLERVDRDLYDTSQRYLPKHQQPVAPDPDKGEPADIKQVVSDLEKPDLHDIH